MVSTLEKRLLFIFSFLVPLLGFILAKGFSKDSEQAQRELALQCAVISSLSVLTLICSGLLMHYF